MSKKISRIIGVLKTLQLVMPKNILLTIYTTLILPHINYYLLVWGNKSGKNWQLQKLFERYLVQDTYLTLNNSLNSMIFYK